MIPERKDYTVSACLNQAALHEKNGEGKKAEAAYRDAFSNAKEDREKRMAGIALGLFYYRGGKLMPAEACARQLLRQFPKDYAGYHLLFRVLQKGQRYEELGDFFVKNASDFQKNKRFLADRLEYLESIGKYSEELHVLDSEPAYMEVMPEKTLRKKVGLLLSRGRKEDARKELERLGLEYGGRDALFCMVTLALAEGDTKRAAALSELILRWDMAAENPPDLIFSMTLFLQSAVLGQLDHGELSEEDRKLAERLQETFVIWLKEHGMYTEEIKAKMEQLKKM